MKKICLLIILCTSIALSVVAGTSPITNHKHPSRELMNRVKASQLPDKAAVASTGIHKLMRERGLTPGDNPLMRKAPNRLTADDMDGLRIASLECLNFDENYALENSPFYLGWKAHVNSFEDSFGDTYLQIDSIYGALDIYVELDAEAQEAKLYYGCFYDNSVSRLEGRCRYDTLSAVYILDWEEFTEGNLVPCNVGSIYDDGSIVFKGDFLFMFYEETTQTDIITHQVTGDTTCVVSPVIHDMMLLAPNAIHRYEVKNSLNHLTLHDLDLLDMLVVSHETDGWGYVWGSGWADINGHGGIIGKPIDPRPIKSGSLRISKPVCPEGASDEPMDTEPGVLRSLQPNKYNEPVYMYQLNGSIVAVYNLYGTGIVENYMYLHEDGTLDFPAQVIAHGDDTESIIYNCSYVNGSFAPGCSGSYTVDSILWEDTYPIDILDDVGSSVKVFTNNILYFTDGTQFVYEPAGFPENVTVEPGAFSADVAWDDSANKSWNMRWRPWLPLNKWDFNGSWNKVAAECEAWKTVDADGDGHGWIITEASYALDDYAWKSSSWLLETSESLDPDNWLITPMVDLKGVLRFSIWGVSAYPDIIMPYVCVGEQVVMDNFVALTEEDYVVTSEKTEYEIDLSGYEGQRGFIAFRHYNSCEQYFVSVDDIFIGNPEDDEINESLPWNYVYELDSTNYTIEGLTPEAVYEVQVQAKMGNNTSDWTDIVYFITLMQPVEILPGDVNKDGVITIKDVTALIDAILSGYEMDETDGYSPDNANVNGDYAITIKDVTALIDMLLSGSR